MRSISEVGFISAAGVKESDVLRWQSVDSCFLIYGRSLFEAYLKQMNKDPQVNVCSVQPAEAHETFMSLLTLLRTFLSRIYFCRNSQNLEEKEEEELPVPAGSIVEACPAVGPQQERISDPNGIQPGTGFKEVCTAEWKNV